MLIDPINSTFNKISLKRLGWRDLEVTRSSSSRNSVTALVKKPLASLIHISDTHICDAQSPARVEYLDRYADPHHPASAFLGTLVGTYRAQEILTVQVLESMIQSINLIEKAPITLSDIDAVLITGDLTDNAQKNELAWASTLLNGGILTPDSGSIQSWNGVGGDFYSPFFWNPHGTPNGEREDYPRYLYGFPVIPELLHAVRAPFFATGLGFEYLAVHGNHDALLQGTVPPDPKLREFSMSGKKIFQLADTEALSALQKVSEIGPANYPEPNEALTVDVPTDLSRDFVDELTWQNTFTYGSDRELESEKVRRYWSKNLANLTLIALDTVNPFGGWQGSLDLEQFNWLKSEVERNSNRYVVITSHHPLQTLVNGFTTRNERRILGSEVEQYLVGQPNVIAWICGHNHRNRVEYFGPDPARGFWQIETASLIDWPQQGRVIEIFLDTTDQIGIASTPIEHQGIVAADYSKLPLDDVNTLAGLSRALSLNDWQRREGKFRIEENEGRELDRFGVVWIPNRLNY